MRLVLPRVLAVAVLTPLFAALPALNLAHCPSSVEVEASKMDAFHVRLTHHTLQGSLSNEFDSRAIAVIYASERAQGTARFESEAGVFYPLRPTDVATRAR